MAVEIRSERPSILLRLIKWLISKRTSIFPKVVNEVSILLSNRKLPIDAPMPNKFEKKYIVERWTQEKSDIITLHPKGGRGSKHIIYFHGGGFVLPMIDVHWPLVAALVDRTGASVSIPLYPVVPEETKAAQDLLADLVYREVQKECATKDIILAGDSAGANMALALTLRLIRKGQEKPGRLLLFAPWLDVTMANEEMKFVEPFDFMLKIDAVREIGKIWAGSSDPKLPECSPLYTPNEELSKLPPTQIFTGQHDVFIVDNRTFVSRLEEVKVDARLFEYAGAPHVFMVMLPTREARDCLSLVEEFVAS